MGPLYINTRSYANIKNSLGQTRTLNEIRLITGSYVPFLCGFRSIR